MANRSSKFPPVMLICETRVEINFYINEYVQTQIYKKKYQIIKES